MIKEICEYFENNFKGEIRTNMYNAVVYATQNPVEQIFENETTQEFYSMFFGMKNYLLQIDKFDEYELEYYKFVEALHGELVTKSFVETDEEKRVKLSKDAFRAAKKLINFKRFFELLEQEK